eukprot:923382_1
MWEPILPYYADGNQKHRRIHLQRFAIYCAVCMLVVGATIMAMCSFFYMVNHLPPTIESVTDEIIPALENSVIQKGIEDLPDDPIRPFAQLKASDIDPATGKLKFPRVRPLIQNTTISRIDAGNLSMPDVTWTMNDYFDRVFVFNLDVDHNKWMQTSKRLKKFGIHAERFPACDWQSEEQVTSFQTWITDNPPTDREKEMGLRKYENAKEWAFQCSFEKAIRTAKERKYARILLLHDNIYLHDNFLQLFNERIHRISPFWKILMLGAYQRNWDEGDGLTYDPAGKISGAAADMVDPKDPNILWYIPGQTAGDFAVALDSHIYDEVLSTVAQHNGPVGLVALREVMSHHLPESVVFYPNLVVKLPSGVMNQDEEVKNELVGTMNWVYDNYAFGDFLGDIELPLVSVIMTCKNDQETIEVAVRSILHQTYEKIEMIVVDDGSTDDTRSILHALALRDPRMKIIYNKENIGTYPSRNVALEASSGEIIAFQDADDVSLPRRIEEQTRPIINGEVLVTTSLIIRTHLHPEYVATFFSDIDLNQADDTRGFPDLVDIAGLTKAVQLARVHKSQYCCWQKLGLMTTVYDRRVFNEIGIFENVRWSGDSEFLERFLAHYKGIILPMDETVFQYVWQKSKFIPGMYKEVSTVLLYSVEIKDRLTITVPVFSPERQRYRGQYQQRIKQ